ncbi:MAG: hypothetical protein WCD89_17465 [Anaerocolumna sp.]
MRKIFYKDCNNNAEIIKEILIEVQKCVGEELIWDVSDLEIVPIIQRDYIDETLDADIEKVYKFGLQVSNEHHVQISSTELNLIIEYTKTIYYGMFQANLGGSKIGTIKIFDGDIIEIDGPIEEMVNIQE